MRISDEMHKLLIEKKMNGFLVVELRDAFVSIDGSYVDLDDARRKVYRQLLRLVKNNWLRVEGTGQQKRYFKTDLFKGLQVDTVSGEANAMVPITSDYSVLIYERNQYKGELEIVFGEINEYQSICGRFPELEPKLAPLLEQAKEHSAQLLGRVNVLTSVLKTLSADNQSC
ncbi:hypothetical protein AB6E04_12515 [Vibrio amylolyticus]|uniref:hypothetical protein n=1 Tax=Vibrio amylolyticus TaxID=2847292 RepID=UPI00354F0B98